MDKSTPRDLLLSVAHDIYRDTDLSADQSEQQVRGLQRQIVALQLNRGVDPQALAAAEAEQGARVQLAAQAGRNARTLQVPSQTPFLLVP